MTTPTAKTVADPLTLSNDDLIAFVGPNARSYVTYLENSRLRMRLYESVVWIAILVPLVWLAYRKLYLGIALFFGAILAISIVTEFVPLDSRVERWIGPALGVAVAVSGKIYLVRRVAKFAARADAAGLAGIARREYLAARGGTSWIAASLAGIFTLGVNWLVYKM